MSHPLHIIKMSIELKGKCGYCGEPTSNTTTIPCTCAWCDGKHEICKECGNAL